MATRIQVRRDTSAAWAVANPVLRAGEIGWDSTAQRWKVGDGTTAWSLLQYNPNSGNMFTPNQASAETDTTGFFATQCTIATSAAYARTGTKSLEMTATNVAARVFLGGSSSAGTTPVTANQTYTFSAWVLAPTAAKAIGAQIYWWTSAGNVAASTATIAGIAVTTSSAWQLLTVTGVAPANAAFASVRVGAGSGIGVGEVYYFDSFQFVEGTGGRFTLPGRAVADIGTIYSTGSPEARVVAPPGSKYVDEAVTTGAVEWVKTTGVAATGWAVHYGNTGVRDITALCTNPANGTLGVVCLRRVDNIVYFSGRLSSTAATNGTIYTLPVGWRPAVYTALRGNATSATDQPIGVFVDNSNGEILVRTWNTSTSQRYWAGSWPTDNAWPTTLP